MSDLPKNTIMDNMYISSSSKDKLTPPSCHPVLIRQNATWDSESMEKERNRIKKVLADMGISENYNEGG